MGNAAGFVLANRRIGLHRRECLFLICVYLYRLRGTYQLEGITQHWIEIAHYQLPAAGMTSAFERGNAAQHFRREPFDILKVENERSASGLLNKLQQFPPDDEHFFFIHNRPGGEFRNSRPA
jgi:hypothetical protein